MCTSILHSTAVSGSAKGPGGWFALDRAHVSYDHPYHADLEHALTVDFVDAEAGLGGRVAVELSRQSARELAGRLLAALDEADAYEDVTVPAGAQG